MKLKYFFSSVALLTSSLFAENEWILNHTKVVPDFPKKNINFFWYSPLMANAEAFDQVMDLFEEKAKQFEFDAICAVDARGFIFGSILANRLELPLVLVRKPGKLPGDVDSLNYSLEYGKNVLELERGLLSNGQRVLIIDDVLATGGTAKAAAELIKKQGAIPEAFFCLIELSALNGKDVLPCPTVSLVQVDGE